MTIISTEKAQAIEYVRQAQKELATKLQTLGDGKEYFADLIVVTDASDNPLFISRLRDGLVEKHEVVIPQTDDDDVTHAVSMLLKNAL
jgi:hypothetical protein